MKIKKTGKIIYNNINENYLLIWEVLIKDTKDLLSGASIKNWLELVNKIKK